jgi:prepilin-type N-terminal cleavage/methylation domain-containing protein
MMLLTFTPLRALPCAPPAVPMEAGWPLPAERAAARSCRGFTLIEIMLVVALMGLILAIAVPPIYRSAIKEPMRLTVVGLQDAFEAARAGAILTGKETKVVFRPLDKAYSVEGGMTGGKPKVASSGTIPESIQIEMLDVNMYPFLMEQEARVRFFPDGTCDELTLVIVSRQNEYRKITLDPVTGFHSIGDVRW